MPVLNFHFLTYKLNRKNQGSGEKMEKTMTVEEKIRRAEEIYNRRNGNNYTYQNDKTDKIWEERLNTVKPEN